MIKVIKRLFGGLATALGFPLVDKQDFVDGFDIVDTVPRGTNKDGYNQPAPNNEYAYDLGIVEEIEKKYRVEITLVVGNTYNIIFTLSIPGSWDYPLTVVHTAGDSGAATYTDIQSAITGIPALVNTTFSSAVTGASTLRFDIVFDDLFTTDYYLTVVPAQGSATCVPINDAISGEKAGPLIPISFANVNFRQQIWSTTCNEEPTFIPVPETIIGGQLLGTPITYIRNEEVFIYGGGFQGAYWNLDLISTGNYNIVGATDPGGTLRIPNGSYFIVRYKRSLSVIGQAIKINNPADKVWEYVEWIRSINLNFRTYKQIQSEGKVSDDGMIFDWTDWLNPMRRMYYFGTQSITGGFLTFYNSDAIYNLDTVGKESILQIGPNTAKVRLSVATQDVLTKTILVQGAKPEASYVAFVRFITEDGGVSTFSPPSNVMWTHSDNLLSHAYGDATSMSLRINIEQIEQDVYAKAEIGIVEFGTDTFKGYLLPQVDINGSTTLSIIDTGLDVTIYSLWDPSTEVEQVAFFFENVRRIKDFDGYKIAGNVNLPPPYDLTAWAQSLTVTVSSKVAYTVPTDFAANQQSQWLLYGYNNVGVMSTEYTSYMPYDTVRLGIRVWWENGAAPFDFWVADVSIDDTINTITDNANPTDVLQYIIECTNLNLSTIIGANGESVGDVVKDIRFTRTLVNPQVIAQGIGIILAGAALPYNVGYAYMTLTADLNSRPNYCIFYSPDLLNNSQAISLETGDEVYALQATNQNTLTLGVNARANDFFGNAATAIVNTTVAGIEVLTDGGLGSVGDLTKASPGSSTVTNRGGIILTLTNPLTYSFGDGVQNIYYVRPYAGGVAYPNDPTKDRFFVIPQDNWFNKDNHTTGTIFEVYGGDCFGQKSYYKFGIDDEPVQANRYNDLTGFYSYNRGNFQLRSGIFPSIGLNGAMYLNTFDTYTYDQCFTPKYPFQNAPAFNPDLRFFYEQVASLYYSQKALTQGYAGGNRIWFPLDTKALEIQYGGITGIEVLLGFSSNGMLLVWQEKRFTAQFFDNTANIKSNTGELLIGNGNILERRGVDYTNYGCSHPWTIKVGKNLAGHDTAYWYCNVNKTFMRIGADGTTNVGLSLAGILNNYMFLADYQDYNYGGENPYYPDRPAKDYGIHSVWNDLSKEYITTIRLMRRALEYDALVEYKAGEWAMDSGDKWGFEQLPVLYRSLIDVNTQPLNDNTAWEKFDYYNDESMLFLTVVWSENSNKWKTYRTFNPKIYGGFENTYVSSHPAENNLIYEHNSTLNEALYYCVETDTGLAATTDPANFKILCTGIGAAIAGFGTVERRKYIVTIDGKNYEITGVNTNDLDMANVDADDELPVATITSLKYSICNCQDPYINPIINEANPRYVNFGNIATQSDSPMKRIEFSAGIDSGTTTLTRSFLNYVDFEFVNGVQESEIKMDTTLTPTDNDASDEYVQGYWCSTKIIWRWGKENKMSNFEVIVSQTEKKK